MARNSYLPFAVALLFSACGTQAGNSSTTSEPIVAATNILEHSPDSEPADPMSGSGELFVDPNGRFRMQVGSDWERAAWAADDAVWEIREGVPEIDAFQPNINVTVEPWSSDLKSFVSRTSLQVQQELAGTILSSSFESGCGGGELAIVEYDTGLRWLTVSCVDGTSAIMATFVASSQQYPSIVDRVRPLLLTLEP